jgi:zinc/manganese transport system substrate-binding protein/manganese/iron transport system substrate-binding protein
MQARIVFSKVLRVKLPLLLGIVALAAAAASCGSTSEATSGSGLRVVATTPQAADLARHVAGDRARVSQMLAANADPHDYEPRPRDVTALADAQVVIRSGGEVDEWLGQALDGAGGDPTVTTLIDAVDRRGDDPHWWQDPHNAIKAVEAIRGALSAADPGGRATYGRNAAAFTRTLTRLDRQIEACMSRIPAEQRKLVTTHDALGYYARRYGITVVGTVIPSLSTHGQASAGQLAELAQTIRAEHVRTIFAESSVNAKVEEAIARETGARVGPALYADTLGPEGSAGATYVGSLTANTRALAEGFSPGSDCAVDGR